MKVRTVKPADMLAVQHVVLSAFSEEEAPLILRLVNELQTHEVRPAIMSLVAEDDRGVIAGYVAASPIHSDPGGMACGFILAPLAVMPASQGQGVGSALVRAVIEQLTDHGSETLLVYGDPAYYSRFGFASHTAESFIPPYDLEFPKAWQALAIAGGQDALTRRRFHCVQPLNRPELW